MKEPLTTFKPEDYLYDDASLAIFLTQSLNDGSEADLRGSLDIGARARGHTDILAAAALSPSALDRLSGDAGSAELESVRRALASLGLRLAVVPVASLDRCDFAVPLSPQGQEPPRARKSAARTR